MIERDVPERLWAKFFRMIRDAIYDLVAEFHPFIALQGNSPNYQSPITEKKLTITLHYLKDTGSLWMTANFCGIHQCTVSKTIRAVL